MQRVFLRSPMWRQAAVAGSLQQRCFATTMGALNSASAGKGPANAGSNKGADQKTTGGQQQQQQGAEGSTAQEQPIQKPTIGKFHKYAREHGVFFAIYFTLVCEMLAWILTFLVHQRYLCDGDVAALVSWMGLSKWIDVEKYADKSISVFGWFNLSGRLALNYIVCSSIAPVFYPALLPACLASAPALKRAVFFGRKAEKVAPK